MAFEVSYDLENEQQFWDGECESVRERRERLRRATLTVLQPRQPATLTNSRGTHTELDDIVSTRCHQHEIIDNSLRSFLNVTTSYKCTLLLLLLRLPARDSPAVIQVVDREQPSTFKPTLALQNVSFACLRAIFLPRINNMYGGR